MTIPNEYKEYFEMLSLSQRKTLKDKQTKLFIKAKGEICVVTVDKGIVKNIEAKTRKCDFLIYDEANSVSYLIELKGAIIDEAFEQLQASLVNIKNVPECRFIVSSLSKVCSYIVSPQIMNFPKGINDKERTLARALASKCKIKVADIFELIKYIKVVPKTHSFSENNRHIICSNEHPLEL